MPNDASILAMATAVPACRLDQDEVAARAAQMFGPSFERLRGVYGNSGIDRRYSPMPFDWFSRPHGWPERNREYLAAALDLLERVAGRVLDAAGLPKDALGAIVTASTTGIATPALDAMLMERMGLPRTLQRLPIFGLGCAGGAIGLARAATLAAAMPERAVLFLVVELCTLAFRRDDPSPGNVVGTALFGDGAAAVLLRCGGTGPAVVAAGEHTWPQSLDVMGWEVTETGLKALFSRAIPGLVAGGLGAAATDFLKRHGLRLSDIDRFVCHPGGPKVIDACETAFGLPAGSLDDARGVLHDFGNMSAAGVLFVLERALADPLWRRALLVAMGPGFSAGFVVLARP